MFHLIEKCCIFPLRKADWSERYCKLNDKLNSLELTCSESEKTILILSMLRPVKAPLIDLNIRFDKLINAIDKELIKRQLKKDYECKLALFKETSNKLKFEDIPWPCDGSAQDMVDILLCNVDQSALKREIRKHQRFWHPDKFNQSILARLDSEKKGESLL